MKTTLLILLLSASVAFAGPSVTTFYCNNDGTGTNVNAGSTTGAPVYSKNSMNWAQTTSTYTPTDGSDPSALGVTAGMWAAVFIDGATNLVQAGSGGYIAQVSNVTAGANGPIVLSAVAFSGTAPTAGTGTRSIRVGGVWNGPYKGVSFPIGFITNAATNGAAQWPYVAIKRSNPYFLTAAWVSTLAGPMTFAGYTNQPGDWGAAQIFGPASSTQILLDFNTATSITLSDLEVATNGTTTVNHAIRLGALALVQRLYVHDVLGSGISLASSGEVTDSIFTRCNTTGTAEDGALKCGSAPNIVRNCISTNNTGSANNHGFSGSGEFYNCISAYNSGHGFRHTGTTPIELVGCDTCSNTLSGVDLGASGVTTAILRNCNFIGNLCVGVTNSSAVVNPYSGEMSHCVFGMGISTNLLGNYDSKVLNMLNTNNLILLPANQTPWVNPAAGNFSINNTAVEGKGYGLFPFGVTVGHPDIGAAQSQGASGGAYTFSQ